MSSSSTITYTRHDARTLPLNCDVAEFHPTRKERLLVACYELKESKDESVPASREGALHVFDVDDEGCLSECATSAANIVPSGVFDAKWRPNSDSDSLLAVALADGTTALYRVDDGSDGIQQVSTSGSEDVDVGMTLFCDWSVTGERLASTSHAGYARLYSVAPDGSLNVISEWQAHDAEAWCCAFNRTGDVLYTGADDAELRVWDLRSSASSREDAPPMALRDRRTHGAGVTHVSPSPHDSNVVLTGSYDECIRLWDIRQPSRPVLRSDAPELRTGGGVWRLKWHPQNSRVVLCALMYEGFSVAQVDTASATMTLSGFYSEHGKNALAYGADWRADGSMVATCSFYDRLLHIWTPQGISSSSP